MLKNNSLYYEKEKKNLNRKSILPYFSGYCTSKAVSWRKFIQFKNLKWKNLDVTVTASMINPKEDVRITAVHLTSSKLALFLFYLYFSQMDFFKFGAILSSRRRQNSQFHQLENVFCKEASQLSTQFRLIEFISRSIQKMATGTDAEF